MESVQIYNSIYTIDSRNNKLFWVDGAAAAHTTTLTSGNYTATALAAHIETKLTADNTNVGDVYTVACPTLTNKMTITNSTSNFSLTFGTNTANSCAYVLGFTNTNKTAAKTYTGENVVCLGVKYLTVESDLCLGQNTYTSATLNNVLAYVPVNVNTGDLIAHSYELAKSFKVNRSELSRFYIRVKDDRGNTVDLNGVDWSMNVVISLQ